LSTEQLRIFSVTNATKLPTQRKGKVKVGDKAETKIVGTVQSVRNYIERDGTPTELIEIEADLDGGKIMRTFREKAEPSS
jgi:hypothetical protein